MELSYFLLFVLKLIIRMRKRTTNSQHNYGLKKKSETQEFELKGMKH